MFRSTMIYALCILQILTLITAFVSVTVVFPYFAIPCALIAVVFAFLYRSFRRVVRQVKRLGHTARWDGIQEFIKTSITLITAFPFPIRLNHVLFFYFTYAL